jgi:hypothetical protein
MMNCKRITAIGDYVPNALQSRSYANHGWYDGTDGNKIEQKASLGA